MRWAFSGNSDVADTELAGSFVQPRVPRDRVAAIQHTFDVASSAPKLRCEVHPVQPVLNFAFRFPTGYMAEVPPLSQFRGGKHRLTTYIRVTPDGLVPSTWQASMPCPSRRKIRVATHGFQRRRRDGRGPRPNPVGSGGRRRLFC